MALSHEVPPRFTYDASSTHFDDKGLAFWDRYGSNTVARLGLREGARVLDVCCGTGGSALPAARAVGSEGVVLGVDISEPLLKLARRKAEREGLRNIEFRTGDMTNLDLERASFDAVVIVFGIFFAPHMAKQSRALARLVRPGGVLAVTTWGPRLFEPLYTPFLESIRARNRGLVEYRPWERITTVDAVAGLLRDAGLARFTIAPESGEQPLERPEDWWTIVLGTGLRWSVDPLDAASRDKVREESVARARTTPSIETNVIYAVTQL